MSGGNDDKKDAVATPAALFAQKSLPISITYAQRAQECRNLANINPYWKSGYLKLAARYEYLAKRSER